MPYAEECTARALCLDCLHVCNVTPQAASCIRSSASSCTHCGLHPQQREQLHPLRLASAAARAVAPTAPCIRSGASSCTHCALHPQRREQLHPLRLGHSMPPAFTKCESHAFVSVLEVPGAPARASVPLSTDFLTKALRKVENICAWVSNTPHQCFLVQKHHLLQWIHQPQMQHLHLQCMRSSSYVHARVDVHTIPEHCSSGCMMRYLGGSSVGT